MITNKRYAIDLLKRRPWQLAVLLLVIASVACICWPISPQFISSQHITSTRIVDRNGELLRELRPDGRGNPVALDQLDSFVLDAVVAIEDRHFYRHFGVNPVSILQAAFENAEVGAVVRGGSTLTMQVARALRSRQHRTIFQKIAEIFLALRLEVHFTKKQILSLWLNRVYFGNQAYGIEAAAQLYFGKGAVDLNVAEAAFLVGLPQRPTAYDPYEHPDAAKERQIRVLNAMQAEGYLESGRAGHLKDIPLSLISREATFKAPHFVEYVKNFIDEHPIQPSTIVTTLDLQLQHAVESLAAAHLQRLGNDRATNAAALVIDDATGDILAYVGSADFWNEAIAGQNDGVTMLRQPGSALKPFTYAVALSSRKFTPATILPDIEVHVPEAGGAFSPLNYDKKFHGPVPLRTALASSYNVPAVRLLREFGPASLLNVLHSAGVESLHKPPDHYGVGLTLGNGEVRMIELAQAYTAFARQGRTISPRAVRFFVDARGDSLRAPAAVSTPTEIDPQTAYLITDILQDPEARSPAFGRYGPLELPFPVAVKTGTSKDYRDNWAVGYTPEHTVAVWVGNFDGSPMRRVSGVSGAGPLFHAIMLRLGPGGEFERPPDVEEAMICPISGKRPGVACPGSTRELFLAGTAPVDTCDVHRVYHIDLRDGTLANTSTPARYIKTTLFTVYPEEYSAWAQKNGIQAPPSDGPASETAHAGEPLELPGTDPGRLTISYPESGLILQMDPVLNPAFQQIKLVGVAASSLIDPSWWIDGQLFEGSIRGAFWPLRQGRHEIELRATDRLGNRIASTPVTFTVLPAYPENEISTASPSTTFR